MEVAIKKNLLFRSTLYKNINNSLLSQLSTIAEQHGLEAKALAAAFDKFMTVQRQESQSVTDSDIESFRADYAKASCKSLAAARGSNLFVKGSWEDADMSVVALPETEVKFPSSQRITPYMSSKTRVANRVSNSPPLSSGKFKERSNAGEIIHTLNAHITLPDVMELDGKQCRIEVIKTIEEDSGHPKYMFNRIEDRAAYIEHRINVFEDEIETQMKHPPHPVASACQEPTVFVGRICCDSEEGRLNAQSLLLEGSIRVSQGERVRLEVSHCSKGFRVFPGQVVIVRGTNPSGHCVIASEIEGGIPLDMPRTTLADLAATGGSTLRMMCAAGPYTAADDLAYEPLSALLERATSECIDVLLLAGPFVDAEHAILKDGLIDETFEEMFESRVVKQLDSFQQETGTRVILLPSIRDLHAHPVLPQPSFSGEQHQSDNLHFVPNPATLKCNEVVIGATSVDWLLAVSGAETFKAPTALEHHQAPRQDRLGDLSNLVFSQRNFFPAYPPPLNIPLDASRGEGLEMHCSPDILVIPSDLAPFAKLVQIKQHQQALVINPGKLTKGLSGGTFARVQWAGLSEAEAVAQGAPAETNAPILHALDKRCRVEIVRL